MPFRFLRKFPGIFVKEIPQFRPPIVGVETSITAFIGWSPKGPENEAVRVVSFKAYEQVFGGLEAESLLAFAVEHFFANGGKEARIIRLADGNAPLAPNESLFRTRLMEPGKGVHLLDAVDLFNLLCVPGLTEATSIGLLQAFCAERRAFLIVDSAETATSASLQGGVDPGLAGSEAMNAAFYFPWVNAPNPLNNLQPEAYPPCGFIAGLYARTDAARGVWKAPAGRSASLTGATGPAQPLSSGESGLLNREAVNCIRFFTPYGTLCMGARTLHGQNSRGSEWKYIPVRRTALFIEESLNRGLQWAVFEPNDENLWKEVVSSVNVFMNNLFRKGAFQGRSAKEAWFARCDRSTTSQVDIDRGVFNLLVGFAPLKPAEFVLLKLVLRAGP